MLCLDHTVSDMKAFSVLLYEQKNHALVLIEVQQYKLLQAKE